MSSLFPELVLIRRGFRDRVARFRRIVARATAWPFGVRLAVYAAAFAAEALAYPPDVLDGVPLLTLVALAALPALWPRTAAVTVYWLLTIAGWVVATTVYLTAPTLPRLLGLAAALYLVHSGAALAAVLPYDAVVEPAVVIRWLLRATAVIGAVAVLTTAATYWLARISPPTYLAATLFGLAAMLGLVWFLVLAAQRR